MRYHLWHPRLLNAMITGMTTCAVGPCGQPRADGSNYCTKHGPKNNRLTRAAAADQQIECPHCHTTGQVRTRATRAKRGVSGGKAVGAVLTGGLSLLAVGLSRRQLVTSARCGNCRTRWTIE